MSLITYHLSLINLPLLTFHLSLITHRTLSLINLSLITYHGKGGVPKDLEKAFEWFMKAAEQGHAEAQYFVGHAYYFGWGSVEACF